MPTHDPVSITEVPTLPTDNDGNANAEPALALLPEALALDDLEEIDVASTEIEVETRMEPRHNKYGKLRGIAWRERNKGRKAVWYVGEKSKGQRQQQYRELKPQFERVERGNDPLPSVGSGVGSVGSVGIEWTSEISQQSNK